MDHISETEVDGQQISPKRSYVRIFSHAAQRFIDRVVPLPKAGELLPMKHINDIKDEMKNPKDKTEAALILAQRMKLAKAIQRISEREKAAKLIQEQTQLTQVREEIKEQAPKLTPAPSAT